jgi:murein DD-endopeptidase MepM/ murein hydrolase activator NlpD
MIKRSIAIITFLTIAFLGQNTQAENLFLKQAEVMFYPVSGAKNLSATFGGVKIPIIKYEDKYYALVAADVRKIPGTYNLRIRSGAKEIQKQAIQIIKGDQPEVVRGVAYKFGGTVTPEEKALAKDKAELVARLNKAAAVGANPKLWRSLFWSPLENMTVTSPFGYTRIYTNHTTIHHGTDLRAKTGTPVYAISSGKVVWGKGKPLYLEGPMVAIDHGNGIISKYFQE